MLRLRPELKGAFLTIAALLLLLFCIWTWIGIRIGIWTYPQYERHIWLVANIPIAHALWSHQIYAGDNASALIEDWKPDQITKLGRWSEMRWFPRGPSDDSVSYIGICVIAKDGSIAAASAYCDDGLNNRIFFYNLTTNDETEYHAAYEAYAKRMDTDDALLATNFPILYALRKDNINPGTNAEDIIENWHPRMIAQFGRWTILRWFPENSSLPIQRMFGVRMIAKNGVIVCANSFSDDGHCSTYFDTETSQDKDDFDTEYEQSGAAKISYSTNGIK